jgi:hypothetical protein
MDEPRGVPCSVSGQEHGELRGSIPEQLREVDTDPGLPSSPRIPTDKLRLRLRPLDVGKI